MREALMAVIVLALVAALAPAQAEDAAPTQWRGVDIEELMANAPDKEAFPEASAVFLYLQEMTDVADDGTLTTTRNKLTRILTLQGRERYSNPSFLYDTESTTIALNRGVTVRSTGREVEVEEDGINDITPAFLEGATIYANVLEKVISFPVVGPGSTMDLQTTTTTTPMEDRSFSNVEYMGDTDPVQKAEFTLSYPPGLYSPTYAVSNGLLGDVEMDVQTGEGELVFTVEDVPALVEEGNMPPQSELLPRVIYSSYGSWDEPAAFFADAFYPHVQTDGDVAAKTAALTSGVSSDGEKVKAIFLDVARNVRNVYLNLGIAGYEPNDASTVLANRYADTRDKAVLLVSMLRAAGIDAYPAAIQQTRGRFDESVPTLKQFNRLLVAIPSGGGYDFLDPFLDDALYGYLRWGRGNKALIVKDEGVGELVNILAFDPRENYARKSMDIAVAPDGSATVTVSCNLEGYFDRSTRMQLKDATQSEKDKVFEGSANAVSAGARSVEYAHSDLLDLTEPVSVSQTVGAPDFAVPQGDMMIVRIPQFPFGFSSIAAYPTLAERRYPFELPCESESVLSIRIDLPDGYEVVRMPENLAFSNDSADWTVACEWDDAENAVSWSVGATFRETRVPVDSYAAFKADYDAVALSKNRLILLRKV
ncbi:MAG: DUF3857 and transglutaminase domain-containing protein [Candidatus Eisenbacteria bacterium]